MQYIRIDPGRGAHSNVRGTSPRRKRLRRTLKWASIVVVALLAAAQLRDIVDPEPGVGHWRSPEAQQAYMTAYNEVLTTVKAPDSTRDVRTRFGTVRVTSWHGTEPGAPVVLLPGHSSGAPMWAENLPSWIGKRTVHALDPIGDAGLSVQSLPLRSVDDQAEWIAQTLHGLGVEKAHVVGHSFGAATAAQFAVLHPELVQSLTLLEPVLVIKQLSASTILWSVPLTVPAPQSWQDHALAHIGGTTVDEVRERTPLSRLINSASVGYSTAMPTPKTLSDEAWRLLSMPVRVDLGEASSLSGGAQAADRVRPLLSHGTVRIWPGGTHSLPMDEHATLGPELLEFWRQNS